MDSPKSIENEVFTDSNESLKKWFQAFVCSISLGIIVFGMVFFYANFQGPDTYYSVEPHSVIEKDGDYIVEIVTKKGSVLVDKIAIDKNTGMMRSVE